MVAGLWAVLFPSLRQADELSSAALRRQPAATEPEDADATLI
jgi:hypothetical protein